MSGFGFLYSNGFVVRASPYFSQEKLIIGKYGLAKEPLRYLECGGEFTLVDYGVAFVSSLGCSNALPYRTRAVLTVPSLPIVTT